MRLQLNRTLRLSGKPICFIAREQVGFSIAEMLRNHAQRDTIMKAKRFVAYSRFVFGNKGRKQGIRQILYMD